MSGKNFSKFLRHVLPPTLVDKVSFQLSRKLEFMIVAATDLTTNSRSKEKYVSRKEREESK